MSTIPKQLPITSKTSLSTDEPSLSASAALPSNTLQKSKLVNKTDRTNFEIVADFFKPVLTAISMIFGAPIVDNKPYEAFLEDLTYRTQGVSDEREKIYAKAKIISDSAGVVIRHAEENIKNGNDAWAGLKVGMGVPMSGKLQFLRGDDLEKEIFYHNVAEYQWAQSQLRIQSGEVKKVLTYEDGDNTTWNKSLDPGDTTIFQSEEKLHEDKVVISASRELNISINANTARTGLVTTETSINPEGLNRRTSRAALPSVGCERLGATISTQYENSEDMGIVALNGTVTHKPFEKTEIKPELIEGAILDKILNSSIGPRINGLTIGEAFTKLAVDKGLSIYEPKLLPRVLFDSQVSENRFYNPHYLHIVKLKEELVDNKIQALQKQGKSLTDDDYRVAWLDFQKAVQEVISSSDEVSKEKVWLPSSEKSELDLVYKSLESEGFFVPDSIRLGNVNYQELLSSNPQAFYEKFTEGATSAMVLHTFNNHGSPVSGGVAGIEKILDEYSHSIQFRNTLASVTCALSKVDNGKYLRKGVRDLRDQGLEIYKSKGAREYLEFRVTSHLMNYFSKDVLKSLKTKSGVQVFNCDGKLEFSPEFKEAGSKQANFSDYVGWLKKELDGCPAVALNCDSVIESALPKPNEYNLFGTSGISVESNDPPSYFYPSDYHITNSKRKYDGKSCFSVIRTIVDKRDEKNPDGQHYTEIQPNSEKHKALPSITEAIEKKLLIVADGDSEGDKTMFARALESGGFANIVLNQLSETTLCREIITQRREYEKEFTNDASYQEAVNKLGIYGVKPLENKDEKIKEPAYAKLIKFDDRNNPVYDTENPILESKLIEELKKKYLLNIVRHSSAEANIRRKAEVVGSISGVDIEFKQEALNKAITAYKSLKAGNELTPEESKNLFLYEHSAVRRADGNLFPSDAPHSNAFTYWQLHDAHGDFIVYKSKSHSGEYVVDRNDGSPLEKFDKNEISALTNDKKNIIQLDNEGKYIINGSTEPCPEVIVSKLNDFTLGSNILPEPSKEGGAYSLIKRFVGEKTAKLAISKLPDAFQGLLRYSGLIIGAGGILRLLSPATFGLSEKVYNFGYKTSNYVRAISAFGGALRGALNVNRYWNITAGEAINICASFMNDGIKHGFLGLGNFVLFMGRGQQAAQRQQRVNNHAEEVLATDQKAPNFKEIFKKYADPREAARTITKLGTSIVTSVRSNLEENGLPGWMGEIGGSLASAAFSPLRMIKDIIKDPKLIYQVVNRQSEKSGGFFKNIPSPGHVMSLVGAASGLSALIAGTIGRKESFGEIRESGFNGWGRWAISAACGLPALGIIANANEVMANIDGLPKQYRGLDGKEKLYNPKAAGLLQKVAGFGFAFASMFDLSDKYAAALYDVANGLYFTGAAEEEGPNAYRTAFAEKRASGALYEPKPENRIVQFPVVKDEAVQVEPALV